MRTRRAFLGGLGAAGALALAGSVLPSRAASALALAPAPPVTGGRLHEWDIVAGEQPNSGFLSKAAADTPLWLYNGTPFQTFRIRRGDRIRARLINRLPEHTAIHWHGVRVPNAMDGVQYVTQPPVGPGDEFTYDFTPPDSGTFFFHSHCNTAAQMGRGLIGILLVEGDEPVPFDAEHVLALKDWRLDEQGRWLPFTTEAGAGRAGTFGTVRSVNGVQNFASYAPAGGDIRVRVLNLDPTRLIDLGVEGAEAFVIAVDGNPVEPFPLHTWRMGAAMRADLHIRVPAPGRTFRVLDYFSAEPWPLAVFTADGAAKPARPLTPRALYASEIPRADPARAERVPFRFSASAGGTAAIAQDIPADDPLSQALLDSLCASGSGLWAINQAQWPTNGHRDLPPPLALLAEGRHYIFDLQNNTPHPHPIHLHGHTFEVLSSSRQKLPRFFADTVVVQPKERVEIGFVAAPGNWMFHCHVLEHQENGMMGWLKVA